MLGGGHGDIAIRYIITAVDRGTRQVVAAQQSVTRGVRQANEALREQTAQQAKAASTAARSASSSARVGAAETERASATRRASAAANEAATAAGREARANAGLAKSSEAAALAAKRSASTQKAAAGSMAGAGAALTGAGHKLSGLTLPIAAIGAASAASAMQFQKDMLMIETEAGGPRGEVKKLTDQVLNLAKTTQVGPDELAKGLYHLESIGLRGSKAMDALKLSAQGASISGADLEETTSALGSAWLVNIKGAGSLTHTMALLNATAGAGNMRLGDLVHAMGTGLLPATKQAGLGIKDAMGAMAVFTDEGYQASSAAAQFSTALHFLYNPGIKASGALESIGMKSSQMAADLHKPKGLLVALQDLKKHLDAGGMAGAKFKTIKLADGSTKEVAQNRSAVKQEQVLGEILPGGRGRIMLTLLNQLDRYDMKLGQIGKTTQHFSKAVAETQETASFRVKRAWSQIQVAGIQLGDKLLPATVPIMEKIAGAVTVLADGFGHLSPHMQTATVAIGLSLAAAAPLLKLTGGLLKGVDALSGGFKRLGGWISGTTIANQELAASEAEVAAGAEAEIAASTAATGAAARGAAATAAAPVMMGGRAVSGSATGAAGRAAAAAEADAAAASGAGVVGAEAAAGGAAASRLGLLAKARPLLGKMVTRIPKAGMIGMGGMIAASMIPQGKIGTPAKSIASGAAMGAGVGMLAGPVGAAVGAGVGAAAGALMDKNLRKSIGKSLSSAGKWVGKEMDPVLDAVADAFKDSTHWIGTAAKNVSSGVGKAFSATKNVVRTALSPVVAVVRAVFGGVVAVVRIALKPVEIYFKVWFAILRTLFKVGWAVVRTTALVAFALVYETVKAAFTVIVAIFKVQFAALAAVAKIGWAIVKAVFDVARAVLVAVVHGIVAGLRAAWGVIKDVFGPPVRLAFSVVKGIFNTGKAMVVGAVHGIVSGVRGAFNGIVGAVSGPLGAAWDTISGQVGKWGGRLGHLARSAVDHLADGFKGIGHAIAGVFGSVGGFGGDIGNAIKNWLNDHTILGDNVKIGPLHAHIPALAGGGVVGDHLAAAVSPGERVIMPNGGQWTVPGQPTAADSVLTQLPVGATVLTWSGQQMVDAGYSLQDAVAHQTPHFAHGGVVKFRTGGAAGDGIPKGYHVVDPKMDAIPSAKAKKAAKAKAKKQSEINTGATWAGTYLATSYGPPWNKMNGTGVTATGKNLKLHPNQYVIAVDPKVIPLHTKVRINPNPFHQDNLVFSAEDTGGAIKGKHIDIFDWRGRSKQQAWGGRQVKVHSATGALSGNRTLEKVKGPRVGSLAPLTAAEAQANMHDLLQPNIESPFRAGYDMATAGLGQRVGDPGSTILSSTIAASRVALQDTSRTISTSGSGGSTTAGGKGVNAMVRFANALDKKHIPYGAAGHSGWALAAAEDCSSTVSKVLHAGGVKLPGVLDTTRLPGALAKGPGSNVTVYDRALPGATGHTIIKLRNRFFGTSRSNPGGGPGWIPTPGAGYLATLPTRLHPPGMRRGGVVGRFRNGGQVGARGPKVAPLVRRKTFVTAPRDNPQPTTALLQSMQQQGFPTFLAGHRPMRVGGIVRRYRAGGVVPGGFTRYRTGGQAVRQRASAAAPVMAVIQEATTALVHIGSKDHSGLKAALTRLAGELDVTVGAIVDRAHRQITALRKGGLTKTEKVDVSRLRAEIRNVAKLPRDAEAISYNGLLAIEKHVKDEIRKLAKGGMSRRERIQGKALQGALSLLQAEMGRRTGELINSVTAMNDDIARNTKNADYITRASDLDSASEEGQKLLQAMTDANVAVMLKQVKTLSKAQDQALKAGDKGTAKEIGDQIKDVQSSITEGTLASIEAARAAVVASATNISDKANKVVGDRATGLSRFQRMVGIDSASGVGQRQTADMLRANNATLGGAAQGLQGKLAQLAKKPGGKNGQAYKAVQEQLDAINDQILENVVQIAEATRAAIVADAQAIADDANTQVQRAQTNFDQMLRRNGIDAASTAGQKALQDFLAGQDAVLQDHANQLQGQLGALINAGGSAADIKSITDAIQGLNDQITENVLQMAEAARQAVLTAAQDAVDASTHGGAMADIGASTLETTQKLAGTYDTEAAKAQRADYITNTTIPALNTELAALQAQQTAIQQQTPNDVAGLRASQEAIAQKQLDILTAQLDAQETIASNTDDLLKDLGGSAVFEFGGQQFSDLLNIPVGA